MISLQHRARYIYKVLVLVIYTFLSSTFISARSNQQIKLEKVNGYNTAKTEVFDIYSSLKRGETRKIVRYINIFAQKADLIYQIKNQFPKRPVIFIFESRKEFFLHVKKNNLTGSKYAGGFFSPQRNEIVVYLNSSKDELIKVLFHEIAHLYTHNYLKRFPQALNEGLSTYFETVDLRHHKLKFGLANKKYLDSFKKQVASKRLMSVNRFLAIQGYALGKIEETFGHEQYAEAWSLMWYCLHGPEEIKDRFKEYITFLRKKPDSDGKVFLSIVVKEIHSFSQNWIEYILSSNISRKSNQTRNVRL